MGSGSACRRGRSKPVLRRLIRYSEKIFDLGEVLGEVSDRRLRPRIPTLALLQSVLWFRQLDLAPFDRLIWPHPAGESSPSMEPPSGLVGTVESALCFPCRCGDPRSL